MFVDLDGHPWEIAHTPVLVVKIYLRLDLLAEAEAQLQTMRSASMTEEGCGFMYLVQSENDEPGTWVMLEQLTSRAAWDEHLLTRHNLEGDAVLEPMLRQPSDLGLYRPT